MKKKIRQIFLLTALICTLLIGFAFGVSAEETFTEGIYTYTVADGEATITDVNITDENDIVLPEILGGYPVTATCYVETISNDIYIHSGIEKIEGLDFWGFASNIYVDENNLNFSSEDGVLYNKDKTVLLKYPTLNKNTSFEVPESVKIIEKAAFYFAVNLEEIKLNEGLEEIRDLSFGYTRINGIDLPSTLKTINGNAFVLCPMIEKIIIPESVNYIDMLFTYFPLEVYIESTNVTFGEWETFGVVDFYMDISRENLATAYKNFAETYDYSELEKCLNESIVQSDVPVVHNKYYCHEGANYIELMDAVATAKNVETLYEYTHFFKDWVLDFENNTATRECTGCTVTQNIYGYSVTDGEASIGKVYVELTGDVYVPETLDGYPVTGIEYFDSNFDNLYIHEGIKEIAGGAFGAECLGNIIVDENNPYFVVEDGALYDVNKERLIKYFASNKRTYFEVPETVVKIDDMAFGGAVYLKELKLNEGLKEIGDYAFGYTIIKDFKLPSTLETIGDGAFTMCPMLEEITIPESVNYIGDDGLFTYFPLEVYMESTNVTFGKYELFGVVDFIVDCTREEYAELLIYALEHNFDDESADRVESTFKDLDTYVAQYKYYCHEGANFIEQMDAAADKYGVDTVYEYTHFFKNWTYDWDGLKRTAKCLYCDETTTESLRSEEDNEIEFIAPADEETTFVVETVEDAESDDYILVTEALEAVEGPAEIEKIYDITLETSEGVAVQPDGSVQVKLPVEESHGNYKVFRVNDDGTYTDMNATVVDGYVVFVTDHFSLYVVVDTTEKTCEHEFDYTKSEANLTRPRQVDGTWVYGYYTYTCSLCGETETEVAKRADYTEYYVVETRFIGVLLNEDIDVNIRQKLLDELQATEVGFEENFIESEQQTLDRFTDYLLACTERAEVCVAGTHYFTKYEEVTAPKCGVAGLEKSVCDYCGAEDENEIPALKHVPLAAVKEKEVAPTCEAAGSYDSVVYCDLCGGEISRETVTVSAKGHTKVTVPGKAATCKETGLTDGVKCSVCGKILTAQKTIAKADHKDKNGDYKCDYGCGHEFERPTPDKCDHMCHQSGFMGFIWKIVQFFWKLFKMNPVCECGAAHY